MGIEYPKTLKKLVLNFRSCKNFTNLEKTSLLENIKNLESLKLNFSGCVYLENSSL